MFVALLIALAPPVGMPVPARAALVSETPVSPRALELARILNPDEAMIAVGLSAFNAGWAQQAANPENIQFEREHRGLSEAVAKTGRALLTEHLRATLPTKRERFARFFASRFDAAEIEGLIHFYSSPTGAKLVGLMYSSIDMPKAVDTFARPTINRGDVAVMTSNTAIHLASTIDEKDKLALASFSGTPLFHKLASVLPSFQQLLADMSNEPTPEFDAQMEATIKTVVSDFLSAEGAHKAK